MQNSIDDPIYPKKTEVQATQEACWQRSKHVSGALLLTGADRLLSPPTYSVEEIRSATEFLAIPHCSTTTIHTHGMPLTRTNEWDYFRQAELLFNILKRLVSFILKHDSSALSVSGDAT
jgi:hypothetical protein